MVVEGAAISVIVGGLTGGLGAGAAGAAALARISAQAPRFHALLTTLRLAGAANATRLRTVRDGLTTVRARVEKFARVPARNERGSVRLPGGGGGNRRLRPGGRAVPQVESTKLKNYIDHLFKGTTNPHRVGDGTTMDAIRHELLTGKDVHGRAHLVKGTEIMRGLQAWLRKNPAASRSDRQVAQSLLDELKEVLGR
ncbi:hypothetical protein [Nocardioides sp.]|uniref:hypothetical protein n=1 Tax=Nocardioides sp. TaxID=35761 RepID=UPI002D021C9F|nr:hypothetical protein [Nocardioides sp.]HXH78958.1 hypothetical protein [Nocardioides sp.]